MKDLNPILLIDVRPMRDDVSPVSIIEGFGDYLEGDGYAADLNPVSI